MLNKNLHFLRSLTNAEMLNDSVYLILWIYFSGALYPTSMRINEQGRLVVNFRTEARFRGLFVTAHSGVLLNIFTTGTYKWFHLVLLINL